MRRPFTARVDPIALLALALAAAIAAATITASMHRGRLATMSVVDNVIYMARGAEWVRAVREGGLATLAREYLARPPHAPYSTALSFAAFELLGVRAWAPSVLSVRVPALGLWWVSRLTRGARWPARAGAVIAATCVPLWAWSIDVIKPDYAVGVLTAVAVSIALRDRRVFTRPRRALALGALVGAALLAKPTVFPGTLLYVGVALASRWAADGLRRRAWRIGRAVRTAALVSAGIVAVAGPHFVLAAGHLRDYIHENMAGGRAYLWREAGSLGHHLRWFLTGTSGARLLGWTLWPLVVGIGIGVAAAVCRRRWDAVRDGWPWAASLGAAFLLPALNRMKVLEFAVVFQVLIVFAFAAAMGHLGRLERRERWRRPLATATALALAAWCLLGLRWTIDLEPIDPVRRPHPTLAERARVAEDVYRLALTAAPSSPSPKGPHVVIAGAPGDVNHNLLTLWSVRDRVPLRASLIQRDLPPATLEARLAAADVVICPGPGTGMTDPRRAPAGIDARMVDAMRGRTGWAVTGRVPVSGRDAAVTVFRRRSLSRAREEGELARSAP